MNSRHKPFVIPIFIPHAGCPHRCVFCNQEAISGTGKPPAAADIRSIILRFRSFNHLGRRPVQAAFFGGNFLGLDPDHGAALLEEAESCVREGLIDNIRFSTRPDTITTDTLRLLSGFSVRTIELGIQSMNDAVLMFSRRGHTAGQSEAALRRLREGGYETGAQIMTGLPGDSGPPSIQTAERLAALAPDFIRIYPTVVISGSALAGWYQNGQYTPASLENTIGLVATLYRIFESRHIPVIRMGLQPTEEMDRNAVVLGGPFHPAFGHLVLSRIYLEKAIRAIREAGGQADAIRLMVHPRDISRLRGLRNGNIRRLRESFGLKSISVQADDSLPSGQVICR